MSLFKVKYAAERRMNKYGIYDLDAIEYNESIRYAKPISIYDIYPQEDIEESLNRLLDKYKNENETNMFVEEEKYEGNTVSINEFVKREPKSQNEFLDWIKSRLHVNSLSYLESKDQQELIDICCQEVKFKWKEIERSVEDSTLTQEEIAELRRRLYVNVISICEKLFNYYVKRADTLKSREVFSDEANFTRIKTLLACDLSRFLNIHPLKHHLAFDMKRSKKYGDRTQMKPNEFLNLKRITIKDLIEDFHLKYKVTQRKYKSIKEHLKDIYDNMPVLDTKRIEVMLRKLPQSTYIENKAFENDKQLATKSDLTSSMAKPIEDEDTLLAKLTVMSLKNLRIQFKSKSMICLDEFSLGDELGIYKDKLAKDKFKTTDLMVSKSSLKRKSSVSTGKLNCEQLSRESDKTVALRLKQDLENLTLEFKRKEKSVIDNEDHQPLLMNLTTKPDQKKRMAEIKLKMKEISKRHKEFLDEIKLPLVDKISHVQPATVEIKFFNNFSIRISDIRVSTRVLRFSITCDLFPPLYNDLNSEIDSEMVKTLDRNLFIGGEVKEIYNELLRTVQNDHLKFDLDNYVQKAPKNLKYESAFTSSILKTYGRTKSINSDLARIGAKKPPWDGKKFKEWNKALFKAEKKSWHTKPLELKRDKIDLYRNTDPSKLDKKDLKHWYDWWLSELSSEDYFKYMSAAAVSKTNNSDYLGLLYHLYENQEGHKSDDMFTADDVTDYELKWREAKKSADEDRNEALEELRRLKMKYERGLWNTNTVLLGGLGNDPILEDESDPVARLKRNLESMRPKSRKIELFKNADDSDDEEKTTLKLIESLKEKKKVLPKERLERVWNMLRMSDNEKIDMAIKYCTIDYANKLTKALDMWELAAELILRREQIIYDLESFERFASDPNRYFLKGHRGSSAARLEEALQREKIYKKIEEVQKRLEPILIEIEKEYNDKLRYAGRPYLDKMKWDRVEMLHYLTEERRVGYFRSEVRSKQLRPASLAEI